MKTLILEAMNGASKAERAGLILLMAIVALAIISGAVMMVYLYATDIKRSARRNAIGLCCRIEDAADRLDKWLTCREDAADFAEIADWASYEKWRETQVPTWKDVALAMIKGNIH